MRGSFRLTGMAFGCLLFLCAFLNPALADTGSVKDYATSFDQLQRQSEAGQQTSGQDDLTCDLPGCAHIVWDEQGQPTALCPLGERILRGDAGMTLFSASLAYRLVLTGGENRVYRSGTFDVSGGDSTTVLIVNTDRNVSLRLNGATIKKLQLSSGSSAGITVAGGAASSVGSITSQGGTLYLSGAQRYASIDGSGITIDGAGTLHVGDLNAPVSSRSGGGFLLTYDRCADGVFADLQRVSAVSGAYHTPLNVTYYDKPTGLCFRHSETDTITVAFAALRKPESGKIYQAAITGDVCKITMADPPDNYLLQKNGPGVTVVADCVIRSGPGADEAVTVAQPASVELHGVNTTGALNMNASTALYAYGSCGFGPVNVGPGATVIVRGRGALGTGPLTVSGVLSIDPQVNFRPQPLPDSIGGLQPTQILIVGDNSAPVADQDVILKIGGDGGGFPVRTDGAGRITLWRSARLNAVDVVALSGNDTYAAVILGGSGTADALPVMNAPVCTRTSDLIVTIKTENAGTVGIQYLLDDKAREMPDVYVPGALLAYAADGKTVTLRDVPYGKVVTLRAFAARNGNIQLNGYTTDAFVFSDIAVVKSPFALAPQSRPYNGYPFHFADGQIPKDATVVFYLKKPVVKEGEPEPPKKPADDDEDEDKKYTTPVTPEKPGAYVAKITIPATDPVYAVGDYHVDVTITKKKIKITPFENGKKKGEPDPDLFFDTAPLCTDDQVVAGQLSRMKGERYGNYPYRIGTIHAEDLDGTYLPYYEFYIAEGSPYFFIDWNYHHYIPVFPLNIIDPVYDEVQLGSGGVLKVQRRTSPVMSINNTYFGTLVTDAEDGHARPFTPSLRARQGEDQVLLILTAEAELGKDGGYATDRDGNLDWRGRRLTLGNWHISHLKQNHISDIAFQLNGVSLMFSLDELTGADMDALLGQNKLRHFNTYFCVELWPVLNAEGLRKGEAAAAGLIADGSTLMRVNAYLRNGDTRVDIAPALRSAKLLVDASGLLGSGQTAAKASDADITETVNGKPVEPVSQPEAQGDPELAGVHAAMEAATATDDELELAYQLITRELKSKSYALRRFSGDLSTALDSRVVVPYTTSESKAMVYAALMRTRPFLITAYRYAGLYGLGAE